MALNIVRYSNLDDRFVRDAWTPSDISTAAWYDASDTGTITESSGLVSQWDDKSGNGNHVTQETGSHQPVSGTRMLNGLNTLDFDGSDDRLVNTSGASSLFPVNTLCHVFVVVQYDSNTNGNIVVYGKDGTAGLQNGNTYDGYGLTTGFEAHIDSDRNTFGVGTFLQDGGSTSRALADTPQGVSITNPTLQYGLFDRAAVNVYVEAWENGVLGDSGSGTGASDTVATTFILGGNGSTDTNLTRCLNGILGEVCIITGILSIKTRQKIEGYLAWKWGLYANLPSTHPWKTAPPVNGA